MSRVRGLFLFAYFLVPAWLRGPLLLALAFWSLRELSATFLVETVDRASVVEVSGP